MEIYEEMIWIWLKECFEKEHFYIYCNFQWKIKSEKKLCGKDKRLSGALIFYNLVSYLTLSEILIEKLGTKMNLYLWNF